LINFQKAQGGFAQISFIDKTEVVNNETIPAALPGRGLLGGWIQGLRLPLLRPGLPLATLLPLCQSGLLQVLSLAIYLIFILA